MFSWWPRPVRQFLDDLKVGSEYEHSEKERQLRRKQIR